MTETLTWLKHRWPTLLGIILAVAIGFDVADGRDVAFVLVLGALGYLVPAALNRKSLTWPVAIGLFVVVTLSRVLDFPVLPVLLGITGVFTVWALATRQWFQATAAVLFGAAGVLATVADLRVGGILVAVGLIGHALWDAWHLRTGKVVTGSYAEWCGVVDVVLGAVVLAAVWSM